MHIIIVGCGKVGMTLTEALNREGHNITVIDTNNDALRSVSNTFDVMGIVGNGASYSVQMDADIESADLLIAVTGSDELNLLCCLIARKAGNCSTIARVRNPVYNSELDFFKKELGLSMTINPEFAAAAEISRILRFPSAIKIDTFAKGRIELLKFRIPEGSILVGCSLMEAMQKNHCDVLICAVERGDEIFIPNGSFVLQEKDVVSFVSSPQNAALFFKKLKIETHQVKSSMIIGGGKTAYYLARMLCNMGISIKIVEKDMERCRFLSEQLPDATIINGDATQQEVLLEEGIAGMESVVSLTDLDEENIVLSLFAKKCSHAKIITKVNRISFDDVIKDFDLGSVIHPKFLTAEYIIQYVRAMQNSMGSNVETMYEIIENKAEALEFLIQKDSPVIGIPLEQLNIKDNILIACINQKNHVVTPRGKDMIQEGDTVIIVTTITGLHDIKDILKN